ncbi:MAG: hypothetical protein ABL940_06380 [Bacteroidia bacterium]
MMMEENNNLAKKGFVIGIVLIIVGFIIHFVNENKLSNNYQITKGKIIESSSGYRGGIGFYYEFFLGKQKIKNSTGYPTLRNIKNQDYYLYPKNYINKTFPVAYEVGNPENNKMLIFEDEFKEFKIDYPDSMVDYLQKWDVK